MGWGGVGWGDSDALRREERDRSEITTLGRANVGWLHYSMSGSCVCWRRDTVKGGLALHGLGSWPRRTARPRIRLTWQARGGSRSVVARLAFCALSALR